MSGRGFSIAGARVALRRLVLASVVIVVAYLAGLFETEGFMPRAACLSFEMPTLVARVTGDLLTAAAYFSIPYSIRQVRKGPYIHIIPPYTLLAFEVFILLCGTGHLSDVVVVWFPWFRADAVLRVATGAVSTAVAAALLIEVPRMIDSIERLVAERDDAYSKLAELREHTEGGVV